MEKYKVLWVPVILILCAGCGSKEQAKPTPPPTEVGVVTISAAPLPITTDVPGRIVAVRSAEVRARATGILLKRSFDEGADVEKDQELFQIDPQPLQAAYDSAKATLARAEAASAQTTGKAKRYESLVKIHAVSQQEYDDINTLTLQSKADVESAKALVETARLNLGYATVIAPITGRIGAAQVTEGALVSQAAATPLAMIQQLDPIYFDFTQSSTELIQLKQALDSGKLQSLAPGQAKVTLLLDDSSAYSLPGKLIFSGISVDPTTGMVTLRAEFPNPDHLLLPGMFARGRLEQAVNENAITAPQRGVALGPNGTATVMVVTPQNIVEARPIKIASAFKDQWVVTSGLQDGEKIIVEGLQKIRPGATVKPVPFVPADATTNTSHAAGAPKG